MIVFRTCALLSRGISQFKVILSPIFKLGSVIDVWWIKRLRCLGYELKRPIKVILSPIFRDRMWRQVGQSKCLRLKRPFLFFSESNFYTESLFLYSVWISLYGNGRSVAKAWKRIGDNYDNYMLNQPACIVRRVGLASLSLTRAAPQCAQAWIQAAPPSHLHNIFKIGKYILEIVVWSARCAHSLSSDIG
jgi:hypothetical protein